MNCNLNSTNYDEFIEIYNNQGRQAAQAYVANECGVDYATFQRRMRNGTSYVFNRSTRKFEEQSGDAGFMSLDDLCSEKNPVVNAKPVSSELCNSGGFDELVVDLMRDRLMEMHRFIRFDQSLKQIVVNSKMLKDSGYTLSVI